MATRSLSEVRAEVERIAALIGAEGRFLPHYGRSDGFATPNIEIYGGAYHYVVQERGVELSHETTSDLDRLLELVFVDVTNAMANLYELHHRIPGQDSRRLAFAYQEELLARLSPAWAEHHAQHHRKVLMAFPFQDKL